ncbi:hypothetical protein HGG76_26860 [Ochrobactrum tritici]|uniref:Uncharacterized protein n=1 Tax=Brucella tritici TaxID=94626 RepID=A0A7X6FSV5_9HYPH|nr:hypothetical protein [Brucella tritici]
MKSKLESSSKKDQSRDRRPLFVGYKSYHEEIWIGAGKAIKRVSEAGEQIVEWMDGSFSIGHANGLRGIDRFKHSSYIVVGARMQPKPVDVENIARAVFGNIERELLTGVEEWHRRDHVLTAKDGTSVDIKVSFHPDELVEVIHKQICHEEIVQDVARGRLVHADEERSFSCSPTSLSMNMACSRTRCSHGRTLFQMIMIGGQWPLRSFLIASRTFSILQARS